MYPGHERDGRNTALLHELLRLTGQESSIRTWQPCEMKSLDIVRNLSRWFVSSNLRQIQPEILRENVLNSLSRLEDTGDEERSWSLHSKFKAILIWCDQSATDCILCASAIKQYHEEWKRQGYPMRPLEVKKIEDANHFVGAI